MSVVRFLRPYRRREIGQTDGQMTYGMHDALVVRGIAEWVDKSFLTGAAISEPVLSESVPSESEPARKPRRFSSKES